MNEPDKENFDKFLEFAKKRREERRKQVVIVTTNQLAGMLGVLHAEVMESMYYSMTLCGLNEKDFRLREKYYRHELEHILRE